MLCLNFLLANVSTVGAPPPSLRTVLKVRLQYEKITFELTVLLLHFVRTFTAPMYAVLIP